MIQLRRLGVFLITNCVLCANTYCQTDSLGWSYFPFKTGDMWEYIVYDGVILDTAQIFNLKDSILADGKIHLMQYRRFINPIKHEPHWDTLTYTVDIGRSQVFQPFGEPTDPPRTTDVPIYKFNAQPGEQWVMYDYSKLGGVGYEMARVKGRYDDVLFGVSTTFIVIRYFAANDSTDTIGLAREGRTLAKGFGLVEYIPAEGGSWHRLQGAVINGITYGDTTKVITSVTGGQSNRLPKSFELFQNYPNPFNPRTTITFSLSKKEHVQLKVYNVLGTKVMTLFEGIKDVGNYEIMFDAVGLQSGIYFYRLTAGKYAQVRKMVLIK